MSEVENQEVNDGKRNFNIESKVFSKAVDECFAGVVITDARLEDNPIVYCNKAFCEITGYNPEEIIGSQLGEGIVKPFLHYLRIYYK
jgi:PAS domain S-box-containing protein